MDSSMYELYPYPLKIIGVGCYVPNKNIFDNDIKLEKDKQYNKLEFGIEKRYCVEKETQSYMGAMAAKEAIANAGIEVDEIDFIINASESFERTFPDGGSMLQQAMGIDESRIPCTTLQSGEVSFLTSLDISTSLIASGRYNNILIVSSEIMSDMIDTSYFDSYMMLGDAASAVVVSKGEYKEGSFINYVSSKCYGEYIDTFMSNYGIKIFEDKLEEKDLCIQIKDDSFVNIALEYVDKELSYLKRKIPLEDFDVIIPQQINRKFNDSLIKWFDKEKIINNYNEFGFCGAASIPMALYKAIKLKRIKRGEKILFIGVGSGISIIMLSIIY